MRTIKRILNRKNRKTLSHLSEVFLRLVNTGSYFFGKFLGTFVPSLRSIPGIQLLAETILTIMSLGKIWRSKDMSVFEKVQHSFIPLVIWTPVAIALIGSMIVAGFVFASPLFLVATTLDLIMAVKGFADTVYGYLTNAEFRAQENSGRKLLKACFAVAVHTSLLGLAIASVVVPGLQIIAIGVIAVGIARVIFKVGMMIHKKYLDDKRLAEIPAHLVEAAKARDIEDRQYQYEELFTRKISVTVKKTGFEIRDKDKIAKDFFTTSLDRNLHSRELREGAGAWQRAEPAQYEIREANGADAGRLGAAPAFRA